MGEETATLYVYVHIWRWESCVINKCGSKANCILFYSEGEVRERGEGNLVYICTHMEMTELCDDKCGGKAICALFYSVCV
jgi:hypothetical protein